MAGLDTANGGGARQLQFGDVRLTENASEQLRLLAQRADTDDPDARRRRETVLRRYQEVGAGAYLQGVGLPRRLLFFGGGDAVTGFLRPRGRVGEDDGETDRAVGNGGGRDFHAHFDAPVGGNHDRRA